MGYNFKRNKKNMVVAVDKETGKSNEIGDMSEYSSFVDGWPYTPENYVLFASGEKEGKELLKDKTGREVIIDKMGEEYYKELVADGVIKDHAYE